MLKICILSAFSLLFSLISQAQTQYTHDISGNRVKRTADPALPVTLISFNAEKVEEGQSALLTWKTSSEVNADRFELERGFDGKNFQQIAAVPARGGNASETTYSFADLSPVPGENLYRLKMVDKDETFTYSQIKALHFEDQVVLLPNPVNDKLKIKGINFGKVQLVNVQGKVVLESADIRGDGIDVSQLPSGLYLVRALIANGFRVLGRVMKQ